MIITVDSLLLRAKLDCDGSYDVAVKGLSVVVLECYLAKFVWSVIREVFKMEYSPSSLDEFCSTWLKGKGPLPE